MVSQEFSGDLAGKWWWKWWWWLCGSAGGEDESREESVWEKTKKKKKKWKEGKAENELAKEKIRWNDCVVGSGVRWGFGTWEPKKKSDLDFFFFFFLIADWDVTNMVNGKLVRWTRSSRSLDTLPLSTFIIKSIRSFIICISATMWGWAISVMDGRLISCRFDLLGALLPFGPSWFLHSALVPSWSSSWVPIVAFFCCSCSSRSWFCLVRCSTTSVRVWTYLSRVVGHGSSPWTLLVVPSSE